MKRQGIPNQIIGITAACISLVIVLLEWWGDSCPASARPAAGGTVLYNGALGSLPASQGMFYQTLPIPASATQSFANGITTLDSFPQITDHAGYFGNTALIPPLDRFHGYTLNFTVQVISEMHAGSDYNSDGIDDRAGLSVIILGQDLRGIELGFWENEIWAQADGVTGPTPGPLFTHAEGAAFDTTAGLIPYRLAVSGDSYTLSSGGSMILSGPLRDYTAFVGPVDPYETPNLVFLGDDTTSAKAIIGLAFVSITGPDKVYLPLTRK